MKINIYTYSNYRDFLRDSYEVLKNSKEGFSHRYFAKRVGMGSPSCLRRIIAGERNLSKDSIQKFSIALGLSKKEQHYFEALVSFNAAKTQEAKRYYLELLNNLRKKKTGAPLSDEQFEYYSNWFYPAIRELAIFPDFSEDPAWIKGRLGNKITSKQASDALQALIRLGMLKRDDTGKIVQSHSLLTTDDDVLHNAACFFHQQILNVLGDTLCGISLNDREIQGITMAVSKKQFKEIQGKIREFYDSIMNYLEVNTEVPEDVIQMQTFCFPLTASKCAYTKKPD